MNLILLAIIAFLIGYLLASSKFSRSIDDTSGKVVGTSKDWAGKVESWWRDLFKKEQPAKPPIVDVSATATTEQIQAAKKRPSRRMSGDEIEE
jgi:hypothetical protein